MSMEAGVEPATTLVNKGFAGDTELNTVMLPTTRLNT